jgi:hypothetical protein
VSIHACTNVKFQQLISGHDRSNNGQHEAEQDRPEIDEQVPEVVLQSDRIFQPKDQNVTSHGDCVEIDETLDNDRFPENEYAEANPRWQRAVGESENEGGLRDQVPLDAAPTDSGNQFVHQSPLFVGAESLVPNDEVESRSSKGNRNYCHDNRYGLKRVAFIQHLKYIGL